MIDTGRVPVEEEEEDDDDVPAIPTLGGGPAAVSGEDLEAVVAQAKSQNIKVANSAPAAVLFYLGSGDVPVMPFHTRPPLTFAPTRPRTAPSCRRTRRCF